MRSIVRLLLVLVAVAVANGTAWAQLPALSYGSRAGAITDISGAIVGPGQVGWYPDGRPYIPCPPTVSYGQLVGMPPRHSGGDGVSRTADSNPLNTAGRTQTTSAAADAIRGQARAFATANTWPECDGILMPAGGMGTAQFYDTYTVTSMPGTSGVAVNWSLRGSFSSLPAGYGGGQAVLWVYLLASPPSQPVGSVPVNAAILVGHVVNSDPSSGNAGSCFNGSCSVIPHASVINAGGTIDVGPAFQWLTNRALAPGDTFIIGTLLTVSARNCGTGDNCGPFPGFTTDFSASTSVIASGGAVVSSHAFRPAMPMAWGLNTFGVLGDGTITTRDTPIHVNGLIDVIDIAGSGYHTVALKRDGTVWAWGVSWNGRLGNGSLVVDQLTPVQVLGPSVGVLSDVMAVAASGSHSLALKRDGTVWAWGGNFNGELGEGGTIPFSTTPVQVAGPGGVGFLTDVVAIAADHTLGAHSLALRRDGTVWAWGYNGFGQSGDGSTTNRFAPVQVVGPGGTGFLTNVVGIAAGLDHSVALRGDGTVWAWGLNEFGQLGDGTTTDRSTPVQVRGPGGTGFLANIAGIAAGSEFSTARKRDGTVWSWGAGISGELGNGSTMNSSTPVQAVGPAGVGLLTDVTMTAGGGFHALAISSDWTVKAWGANFGRLGNGTTADSSTPVTVSGLTDAVLVAGGRDYSLALALANTLVGSPVVTPVDPATGRSPVTLTFSNVTQPGVTTVSVSSTGPTPPAGFQLGNGTYYEITSGAIFSSVRVCIDYSGTPLVGTQPILQHFNATTNGWETGTNPTYTPAPPNDTMVCATFTSLSPFGLFVPTDLTPPTVTCSVTPNAIGPPNHRLVPVTAMVTVDDPESGPAGFALTSVASNEPDNGLGDGDQPNDIQGFDIGAPSTRGSLRAERSGRGSGRVYTLTYTGRDVVGNTASCSATVTVPHDQRRR